MEVNVVLRRGYLKKIKINNANAGIRLLINGVDIASATHPDSNGNSIIDLEQRIKDVHVREYYNRVFNKANSEINDWENSHEKLDIMRRLNVAIGLTTEDVFLLILNDLPKYDDRNFRKVRGKKFQGLYCNEMINQAVLCNVENIINIQLEYV